MKSMWNDWLKQAVFLYSVLYTFATILNSVLYLLKGHYEDPNGNWHELDRAIIVFIIVLAYILVKKLKINNYWIKTFVVYIPTLILVFVYIWLTGFREALASSAYRDIFINYTVGYLAVSIIGWIKKRIKNRSLDRK